MQAYVLDLSSKTTERLFDFPFLCFGVLFPDKSSVFEWCAMPLLKLRNFIMNDSQNQYFVNLLVFSNFIL